MNTYTQIARKSIETYINKQEKINPDILDLPRELLENRRGVFVTIYKNENKEKSLRGCIGTILPFYKNIAEEIINNAIASATEDNRFIPVSPGELKSLTYEVSILNEPEEIKSISELDPKKFGIIIKSKDGRTGVLLPDIEGVDTTEKQIDITLRKANISPEENITTYKFTVDKFKEDEN